MPLRWAGVDGSNNIVLVSSSLFEEGTLRIAEIPAELESISSDELISDYHVAEDGRFTSKHTRVSAGKLKVAFVCNWREKCGLASYNHKLIPEIVKYIDDYRLFIEENNDIVDDGANLPEDKIISCWQRNQSLQRLVIEIKKFNPDIILIGHEFGLFPNSRYWLSMMCQLQQYRIITTMHSVFPNHQDKVICEAAMNEIIVHIEGAKAALEDKGIKAIIHTIPHGCDPYIEKPKPWNFYRSKHCFIQTGFGNPYKRFEDSILATSILKNKYSDVFFTALFSESPYDKGGSSSYYNKLMSVVSDLKLEDSVAIIRGYQTDKVMEAFIRMNVACVLPYGSDPAHKVFGASGIARNAMSFGVPVISSYMEHFSDLPTIKCANSQEIAVELEKLFLSNNNVAWQVSRQNNHVLHHSWKLMALKYIQAFTS